MRISDFSAKQLFQTLLFISLASVAGVAPAQSYPSKPIRILVGFVPGGGYDTIARLMGRHLSINVGQSVVIENRPGAGGNLAAQGTAKSPADGYTILHSGTPHLANALLYKSPGYDPIKDFLPITMIAISHAFLVVHPSVPANNLEEFVAIAKTQKEGILYGTTGFGTPSHLAMELLKSVAGFQTTHVPHKGAGDQMLSLLAGRTPYSFLSPSLTLTNVKAGKLKVLAVASPQRAPQLPNVPTIAESGYPGFDVTSWNAWWIPAGVRKDIQMGIFDEVAKILRDPKVREEMSKMGADPVSTVLTPEQFLAYMQSETVKISEVLKESDAKID